MNCIEYIMDIIIIVLIVTLNYVKQNIIFFILTKGNSTPL